MFKSGGAGNGAYREIGDGQQLLDSIDPYSLNLLVWGPPNRSMKATLKHATGQRYVLQDVGNSDIRRLGSATRPSNSA